MPKVCDQGRWRRRAARLTSLHDASWAVSIGARLIGFEGSRFWRMRFPEEHADFWRTRVSCVTPELFFLCVDPFIGSSCLTRAKRLFLTILTSFFWFINVPTNRSKVHTHILLLNCLINPMLRFSAPSNEREKERERERRESEATHSSTPARGRPDHLRSAMCNSFSSLLEGRH